MIFFRSLAAEPPRPSIRQMRLYTATALIAFPAGLLLRRLDSNGPAWSFEAWLGVAIAVAAVALMILSFWMIYKVWTSPLQQIVAAPLAELDEREVQLRQRALSWSYKAVGASVLLMIAYAALGSDFGVPMPDDYEEWNGIFWCAFVYMATLPAARLAWTMSPEPDEEE